MGSVLLTTLTSLERKQTNADRIRAMTDEELAKFLGSIVQTKHSALIFVDDDLFEDWSDWLRQEAE